MTLGLPASEILPKTVLRISWGFRALTLWLVGQQRINGVSLSQAQAIPNTRVARGGISPSQWLEADEASRLANAGKFSLALNAVVAEGQALAGEVPSALSGECK